MPADRQRGVEDEDAPQEDEQRPGDYPHLQAARRHAAIYPFRAAPRAGRPGPRVTRSSRVGRGRGLMGCGFVGISWLRPAMASEMTVSSRKAWSRASATRKAAWRSLLAKRLMSCQSWLRRWSAASRILRAPVVLVASDGDPPIPRPLLTQTGPAADHRPVPDYLRVSLDLNTPTPRP